jgi:hypothetical protein
MDLFNEAAEAFDSSRDFVKYHIEEESSIEWMGVAACVSGLEPVSLIERDDGLLGLAFRYKETITEAHFSTDVHGNERVNPGQLRYYPSDILYGVYDQQGNVFTTKKKDFESLCSSLNARGV